MKAHVAIQSSQVTEPTVTDTALHWQRLPAYKST